MDKLDRLGAAQLASLQAEVSARFDAFCRRGLDLDMTRGKPSPQQLDLSAPMLELPGRADFRSDDGVDCRNYGGLDGIGETRALFAAILDVPAANVVVGGNSSLTLMHDALVRALLFGVPGGPGAWRECPQLKFLCPSPGYDRHFALTEHLGFELVAVDMGAAGPELAQVRGLVREDPAVKGMWCVPRYSNPTGISYSAAVVQELASMPTAAPDFRLFWDNAYAEHHLGPAPAPLENVFAACHGAGNPERVLMFASTSKMTFAGAGVAAVAGSDANIADLKRHLAFQSIGPDKVNQLRHARMFPDPAALRAHMQRHAELVRPKFEIVQEVLERELGDSGAAVWTLPEGGYFISLDTQDGCAREVVALAQRAGVRLTAAGATFPYGRDPRDRNIRIAPTFPPLEDIRLAMEVLAVCILWVAVNRRLQTSAQPATS